MKQAGKKFYLEIVRVIALICIVYNHTGPRGNSVYTFTNGQLTFVISLLSDIVCRIGVPLFLMISGALLLQKEESWQDTYKKRVVRILCVIVIFTAIRYLYECFLVKTISFSVMGLVKAILGGNLFLPYWYLYTYLSLLLIIPFLRKMIKSLTQNELDIFVILILGFHVLLPLLSTFLNMYFEISFMISLNCCYLFLGYYLDRGIGGKESGWKSILTTICMILVCVAVSFWMVIKNRSGDGTLQEANVGMLTPLIAIGVFFVIKEMFKNVEGKCVLGSSVTVISSCSFGIYLIEDYLRNGLAFIFDFLEGYISTFPACAVWLVAVFVVGVTVVSILKRMPILRTIL